MLEAVNYKSTDFLSSINEETVDMCSADSTRAPVTEVFPSYVDLAYDIPKRSCNPAWTKQQLSDLQSEINKYKERVETVLGFYKASWMRTSKPLALNHILYAWEEFETIAYLHAGLFESSHKLFRKHSNHTSKKSRSPNAETLPRGSTAAFNRLGFNKDMRQRMKNLREQDLFRMVQLFWCEREILAQLCNFRNQGDKRWISSSGCHAI